MNISRVQISRLYVKDKRAPLTAAVLALLIGAFAVSVMAAAGSGKTARAVYDSGLPAAENVEPKSGWRALDRGNFETALEEARSFRETAAATGDRTEIALGRLLEIYAYLNLGKRTEARAAASAALDLANSDSLPRMLRVEVFFAAAEVERRRLNLMDAIDLARKGREAATGSRLAGALYKVKIGQIFCIMAWDVSAIVWLDAADKELREIPGVERYRIAGLRCAIFSRESKADKEGALRQSEKLLALTDGSVFEASFRDALYFHGGLLSDIGQGRNAYAAFERGLRLSKEAGDDVNVGMYLTTIALNQISDGDYESAGKTIAEIEATDSSPGSEERKATLRAVFLGVNGRREESDRMFAEIEKAGIDNSPFMAPMWRLKLAVRRRDWNGVLSATAKIRQLAEKDNARDVLPGVEVAEGKALLGIGRRADALEHAWTARRLIEDIRSTGGDAVSLQMLNEYHDAFRLAVDTNEDGPARRFLMVENLKARVLHDRINGRATARLDPITRQVRARFYPLTLRFLSNPATGSAAFAELSNAEKNFTRRAPENKFVEIREADLGSVEALADSTVVSYFVSTFGDYGAFVWDRESGLREVRLDLNEKEAEELAKSTREKIVGRVFYKRDGQRLFNRLLLPLGRLKRHVVLIPDRSLWAIPFQALSPDGQKYVIEEHTVSYAPSASILISQLTAGRAPKRRTLAAFANDEFEGRRLDYVNFEAEIVAQLYGSTPYLSATAAQFRAGAPRADIIHLSMHAEIDRDQELDSYLGFRRTPTDDGRLRTADLLGVKLRKGSLAFIASCDTNSINNAEGVVSLAWGMTAAGATTVVSSGWEADDRSTADFSEEFYRTYKGGASSAEAIRAASLALITNKSKQMHEPYYWAAFTLFGDFR